MGASVTRATELFLCARNELMSLHGAHERASERFEWPALADFNWATDYFDVIGRGNSRPALRVVDDAGGEATYSYSDLVSRSAQVANLLTNAGLGRGDRLMAMLGNVAPLWIVTLAAIRAGIVIVPTSTLLQSAELQDRCTRGRVKAVVTHPELTGRFVDADAKLIRLCVDDAPAGWTRLDDAAHLPADFTAPSNTRATDPLMLYFTSGTSARPKLVEHTHASYPVGHLSTMYWLGLKPGDVHLNLSAPGWAKHAWSAFFAPWNAEATVLAWQYERFSAANLLRVLARERVTTFCAPPTVWRLLIQQDLGARPESLREAASAGEPLNPEVIEQVRSAWGITVRDGFGQTETTAQIGNTPGSPVKPGSMGRPLPGYRVALLDTDGNPGEEGELCLRLAPRPMGLMTGYADDPEVTAAVMRDGFYHTGDVARMDADGYLTYVGRADDVFKSADYRISPFELESVLIEHAAVAEAAVVPSPEPTRLSVPKAFIALSPGYAPDVATAAAIFAHVNARVAPFKRIRRIEFAELPKTTSGKIRRAELRRGEGEARAPSSRREREYWEQDIETALR